jgi:hypothetical protein
MMNGGGSGERSIKYGWGNECLYNCVNIHPGKLAENKVKVFCPSLLVFETL